MFTTGHLHAVEMPTRRIRVGTEHVYWFAACGAVTRQVPHLFGTDWKLCPHCRARYPPSTWPIPRPTGHRSSADTRTSHGITLLQQERRIVGWPGDEPPVR
jgi:hypothetical protein